VVRVDDPRVDTSRVSASRAETGRPDLAPSAPHRLDPNGPDPIGTDLTRTDVTDSDPAYSDPTASDGGDSVRPGDPAADASSAHVPAARHVGSATYGSAGASAPVSPSGRVDVAGQTEQGRPDGPGRGEASGRSAVTGRRTGDEEQAHEDDAEVGADGPLGGTDLDEADESPMRPGDVEQTRITLWDDEATRQFHDEWHEVKAQFVDDPVAALTRAHDLLTEAVHELTESLLAERDDLDPLRRTSAPDTESMRMAMRGYREFLDRILAL
jgi:hypothetical protein